VNFNKNPLILTKTKSLKFILF